MAFVNELSQDREVQMSFEQVDFVHMVQSRRVGKRYKSDSNKLT